MNDAEKLSNIPEEIILKSYLQRIIDHLSLVYDPAYSMKLEDVYHPVLIECDVPEIFFDGRDLLEYTRSLMPENGKIKNSGYLTFLAFFAGYSLGAYGTILNFNIPDGDDYVTPENIGYAESRYPGIHGVYYVREFTTSSVPNFIRYSMLPLDLTGSIVRTYNKHNMARCLDFYLDSCNAILHRHWPFYNKDEPEFYKKTDLYCLWNMLTIQDGEVVNEADTRNYGDMMYGKIGWISDGTDDSGSPVWKEKRMKLRLEIHSVSAFRYKYVVLCTTRSDLVDYGGCRYDFAKSGKIDQEYVSVIYESPDWCEGDLVWEYEFDPGVCPSAAEDCWEVMIEEPSVIIYPEYPDRLKEFCEE